MTTSHTPEPCTQGRNPRSYGRYGATLPAVRVPNSLRARVDARAVADDVAVTDLIRTAVQEWLDQPAAYAALSELGSDAAEWPVDDTARDA